MSQSASKIDLFGSRVNKIKSTIVDTSEKTCYFVDCRCHSNLVIYAHVEKANETEVDLGNEALNQLFDKKL